MSKVIFDGDALEIIVIDNSVTNIDVQIDLYSDWKEWMQTGDHAKYPWAFRTFGGDPTISGQFAPRYFFLINGWRVRVKNNQMVTFASNLYSTEYDTPFIIETGSGVTNSTGDASVVNINGSTTTTNDELSYAGVIYYNSATANIGTSYPVGTVSKPVNNLNDALALLAKYNAHTISIRGSININIPIEGINFVSTTYGAIVDISSTVNKCSFDKVQLNGNAFASSIYAVHSEINLSNYSGRVINSNILTTSPNVVSFYGCDASDASITLIENSNAIFHAFSGKMTIVSNVLLSTINIGFSSGSLVINSGVVGVIKVSGIVSLLNQSADATINSDAVSAMKTEIIDIRKKVGQAIAVSV